MTNGSGRQPGIEPLSLGAAFGTEAMVHGQRADFAMSLTNPTIRENRERQAVWTAGYGNGDERASFEARDGGECAVEFLKRQRFCTGSLDQQPSRFFSVTARSLIALPGFGKS